MTNKLTVMQQRFITAKARGLDGKAAAIEAGYSPRSAKHTAYSLMNENVLVMAELDRIRDKMATEAEYTLAVAMQQALDAIAFAKETGNATAYVGAIKHHAQLGGHLETKLKIDVANQIDIAGALAEAKARAFSRLRCDSAQPIEGEALVLPSVAARSAVDNKSLAPIFYDNKPDMDL